jgi:hypothetical protein
MTKKQLRAIEQFRAFMQTQLDTNESRGDAVSVFEITTTEMGAVWIHAETEMLKLPQSNLLRAVSHQHWHVNVGKGGRLEVWSAPKSFHQFKGGRAFGMSFIKI